MIDDAARRAGISRRGARPGDPPQLLGAPAGGEEQSLSLAFGCKSNRVFTQIGADEAYAAIPAGKWDAFVDKLYEVQRATLTMGTYFQAHAAKFAGHK